MCSVGYLYYIDWRDQSLQSGRKGLRGCTVVVLRGRCRGVSCGGGYRWDCQSHVGWGVGMWWWSSCCNWGLKLRWRLSWWSGYCNGVRMRCADEVVGMLWWLGRCNGCWGWVLNFEQVKHQYFIILMFNIKYISIFIIDIIFKIFNCIWHNFNIFDIILNTIDTNFNISVSVQNYILQFQISMYNVILVWLKSDYYASS